MNEHDVETLTPVERAALAASPFAAIYPPSEKMPAIVVDNFPALGRLTAMRFIEWVQANPEGVVSLPTGKTPEHFIGWVRRLLETWDAGETRVELECAGVDPTVRPQMRGLHFVQIDEFYPIPSWQHNSFHFYVSKYYLEGFGLDAERALLIDCSRIALDAADDLDAVWPEKTVDLSLRYRQGRSAPERRQKDVLHRIDDWCQAYEERIRALGGIGFFLGGIGPDGHIGFNVRGSDHHSTTRLTPTNYETQAAAAGDLGGIEVARRRLVITIGLGTITANPDCTAVIIAAGEAKAGVVADAVQREPSVLYPATALHALPNARFYVTGGAARLLDERRLAQVSVAETIDDATIERIVFDLAVSRQKRLDDLDEADFAGDRLANAAQQRRGRSARELAAMVRARLIERIERGSRTLTNTRFLHTEPHHDDIMLGYLASIVRHGRDISNSHHFASLTGGFTAVTNQFMTDQLERLRRFLDTPDFAALARDGYFDAGNDMGRNRDVWQYLDGVAAARPLWRDEGAARRMLRNLMEVYEERDLSAIGDRIAELLHYFETQYPGKKDPQHIQRLKSMCREWEVECLWGYFGWNCASVDHLRLGFYTGDIFPQEPTVERDVLPVLRVIERARPDVVTVALDPEGSGPDTHYKVLQVMAEALRRYEQDGGRGDVRVWGYRNVWYRFHPAEADIYVPVSLNMLSIMQSAFRSTFVSQRTASFPSYEHDGPFSDLAQKIQVEQYQSIKVALGRRWFHEHPSALMRATRGFVFLKDMSLDEFYRHARELQEKTEASR